MDIYDLAKKNDIKELGKFYSFLKDHGYPVTQGGRKTNPSIDDAAADEAVAAYLESKGASATTTGTNSQGGYIPVADIALKYGISADKFFDFLKENNYPVLEATWSEGAKVKASVVDTAVGMFKYGSSESADAYRQWSEQKRDAVATMLVTAAASFDGYSVTKYSGFISGDGMARVGRSSLGAEAGEAISKIRRRAIDDLKSQAFELGCNAIIGVDFDYITMDPSTALFGSQYLEPYLFVVTANGNAVVIEKNE